MALPWLTVVLAVVLAVVLGAVVEWWSWVRRRLLVQRRSLAVAVGRTAWWFALGRTTPTSLLADRDDSLLNTAELDKSYVYAEAQTYLLRLCVC